MASPSSETNVPIGDWTLGSLKVHHDDKIEALKELTERRFTDQDVAVQAALVAQEKAVAAALTSTREAVNKAEAATEKRFASVNEFRAQLADQTRTFMPRAEAEQGFRTLSDKIVEMSDRMNRSEGSAKGSQVTTAKLYAAIAAVGTVLGITVLLANNVF